MYNSASYNSNLDEQHLRQQIEVSELERCKRRGEKQNGGNRQREEDPFRNKALP